MSVPQATERERPAEAVAGFLAAAAIFVSLMGIAYRPVRLVPVAILLALVSAGIGGRSARLATFAVATGAASFAIGMAVAVLTGHHVEGDLDGLRPPVREPKDALDPPPRDDHRVHLLARFPPRERRDEAEDLLDRASDEGRERAVHLHDAAGRRIRD